MAMFIAGCNSQIKQLPDSAQVSVPDQWEVQITERGAENTASEEPAPSLPQGPVENGWLTGFGDNSLVDHAQTALENNPNLLASAAQLKSAIEFTRYVNTIVYFKRLIFF